MNKLIYIDSLFAWKINCIDGKYVGNCGRLGLKIEADSLQEFIDLATKTMYDLFKDKYNDGTLNEFSFKHSAAYRVKDFEGYIDLSVPIIIKD